jgi:LacI family repressor for deo operon, udp, cdd, tsx, nupC, and nupG
MGSIFSRSSKQVPILRGRTSMSNVKKVAHIAGVSSATVSRALNRPEMVADETRQKVVAAAAKVGYAGNYLARNLRVSKTSNVVVLVPNIANPFFSEVIRGIERVAHGAGYCVLLGDTQNSQTRERAYENLLATKRADGLITLSPTIPMLNGTSADTNFLEQPIVNACECLPNTPMRTVQLDNLGAARKATEYLLSLGHRRIGFVAGPQTSPLRETRLSGYRLAMESAGIQNDGDLVVDGDFSIQSGVVAAGRLLSIKNPPTAIFCSNDEMALGVMSGVKGRGMRIPRDISIVGFDDILFAQYFDPPLTTIAQPMREIGEHAMTVLAEILAEHPPANKDVILPFRLVVRSSSGPCKSR